MISLTNYHFPDFPNLCETWLILISWSSEYSSQGQALHCKRRELACSSPKVMSFTSDSGTKVAVLLGMNRCASFPFISVPHSLFSIWIDLKRSENILGAPKVEVRRVDLANWALRTSPKFTTGIKYRVCQNSPYRPWGLVLETKAIKFSIGTSVRKRTVFPLHAKSPHTLFRHHSLG